MVRSSLFSRERLLAYLQGRLPGHEEEILEEHFAKDPEAWALLASLEQEPDSLIDQLRQALPVASYAKESACREALQGVQQISVHRQSSTRDREEDASSSLPQWESYTFLEKIGQGGMGTVYKARHTRLGKEVAIKMLSAHRLKNPQWVARFEREIQFVGQLDHPQIVCATDAGEVEGVPYLVMEFVSGRDLDDLVNSQGPLPIAAACELVRQAATGLQYAHEKGLIHRDIKPSNLMLNTKGEVKMLDLGLARAITNEDNDELTSVDRVLGTLDYLAPEQGTSARQADARSDIYSLGCTLYKLLTGRAPFSDQNLPYLAKMIAHAQEPVIPPQQVRPDLPPALSNLVLEMMAKQPEQRPATAGEVAERLMPFTPGVDLATLLANAPSSPTDQSAGTATWTRSGVTSGSTTVAYPQPASLVQRYWGAFVAALVLVLIGGGFALLSPILLRYQTEEGTLVVELADDSVEARIRGKVLTLHDTKTNKTYTVTLSGKVTRKPLPPGDYLITVVDDAGIKVEGKEFSITRGKEKVVRIYVAELPQVVQKTPQTPRVSPPENPKDPHQPTTPQGPDPRADEEIWVVDITTKLNANVRFKLGKDLYSPVGTAWKRSFEFSPMPSATYAGGAFTSTARFYSNYHVRYLGILLEMKDSTWIFFYHGQVRTIEAKKDQHVVTLFNGDQFEGSLWTKVRSETDKWYELRSVKKAELIPPRSWKQEEPKGKIKWLFQTPALAKQTTPVLGASFVSFGLNHRFLNSTEAFTMTVNGEAIQGHLNDFQRIEVFSKDGQGCMRVVPKKGVPPVEGTFSSPWLRVGPTAGYALFTTQFTLEKYIEDDRKGNAGRATMK